MRRRSLAVVILAVAAVGGLLPIDSAHASPGDPYPTFGTAGRASVDVGATEDGTRHLIGAAEQIDVSDDGEVAVAGSLDSSATGAFISRLDAAGERVGSFGDGGTVTVLADPPPFEDARFGIHALGVKLLLDGRTAALLLRNPGQTNRPDVELWVFEADGDPDPTFGGDGHVILDLADQSSVALTASLDVMTTASATSFLVGGARVSDTDATPYSVYVQKVSLNGTVDSAFGATDGTADGIARFAAPIEDNLAGHFSVKIAGAADGTVAWAAFVDPPGSSAHGIGIGRYAANGGVDSTFGSGGSAFVNPDFALGSDDGVYDLARRSNGGVDVVGEVGARAVTARTLANGSPDTTYSGDGATATMLPSPVPATVLGAVHGDHAVFAFAASGKSTTQLLRLTSTGAPDTTFGPSGIRSSKLTPRDANRQPHVLTATGNALFLDDAVAAAGPSETPGRNPEVVKLATGTTPPGPPTEVWAVAGDTTARVSWVSPADGGSTISGYTVTSNPPGGTCTANQFFRTCKVTGLTNGTTYTFSVVATNGLGDGAASAPSNAVAPAVGAGKFVPLQAPKRIEDSRVPNGDTDDEFDERMGPISAGEEYSFNITNRVGVAQDATTAVISIASVNPTANGFFTLYRCDGGGRPLASSMNFTKGTTIAKTVIVALSPSGFYQGSTCLYSSARTDFVVDVVGTIETTAYTPAQARLVDSRVANGNTDDDLYERFGTMPAGSTQQFQIAGRLGIPAGTKSVALSIAAVNPASSGHLIVYPCGSPRPATSSINFSKGVTIANTVITALGSTGGNAGKVCVFAYSRTDVVVDATGYFADDAFLALPAPRRILDSRTPNGDTDDEQFERLGPFAAGSSHAITVAGRVGLGASTHNVVLDVAVVTPSKGGFLTLYPCGNPRPLASSMNFTPGVTIANTVVSSLGSSSGNTGKVCVYTNVTADVVIDVSGAIP